MSVSSVNTTHRREEKGVIIPSAKSCGNSSLVNDYFKKNKGMFILPWNI